MVQNNNCSNKGLYSPIRRKVYNSDAGEAAFLLGGIGTGNVSVGARGDLRDWEIFNRPGKHNKLPYTFFAIWAKKDDGKPIVKKLESRLRPPYARAHGIMPEDAAGLPHLEESSMIGEYPFVWVEFRDSELPVHVTMEAFTPFIPLNADDSGIPGAIFRYRVKNKVNCRVDVSIAGSMGNVIGDGVGNPWNTTIDAGCKINEYRDTGDIRGLYYTASCLDKEAINYGNMALVTPDSHVSRKQNWLNKGWWDGIHDFWADFCEDGRLEAESTYEALNTGEKERYKVGSLCIHRTLMPGEEAVFEFYLTWYFPNRIRSWYDDDYRFGNTKTIRNYYSTLFKDAWDAAGYLHSNLERLEMYSREFHRALFTSTLPDYVIDALSSNITVLRSNTCFRVAGGHFLSYEGCSDANGCCEGNCTHVWNYAQTLAFLFPELERSMRSMEFNMETDEDGRMSFRSYTLLENYKRRDLHPAADGQMGTVIRLFRDWKLSGDDGFLASVWQNAVNALDFALKYWDKDGDSVLDSQQHNTYDIEFYGPNSLVNSIYLAALKAAAHMAEHLGDAKHAADYRDAYEKGSKRVDELLWNGEYYIQRIDDVNRYLYQYGKGCLSDQVFGQLLAHIAGIGYILPREHVRESIYSVYKYNFKRGLYGHNNVQRVYALNDESGVLLCTWPHGGRPRLPFVYSDEVWTGIEYQVAAHLIYEGFVAEGLEIVKAVRDRFDGYRRNPWNEYECGHHYVRSMASWGLLIALSGFKYDMAEGAIEFNPVINRSCFSSFWSTGKAWGIYRQTEDENGKPSRDIEVIYGSMEGISINKSKVAGEWYDNKHEASG